MITILMTFFGTFILLTIILILGSIFYLIKYLINNLKKKEPEITNKKFNDSLINLFSGLDNELIPDNTKICERCGYEIIMKTKRCPYCKTKL